MTAWDFHALESCFKYLARFLSMFDLVEDKEGLTLYGTNRLIESIDLLYALRRKAFESIRVERVV
jgi:hypothetical protein